jgi:hypothetical protein
MLEPILDLSDFRFRPVIDWVDIRVVAAVHPVSVDPENHR